MSDAPTKYGTLITSETLYADYIRRDDPALAALVEAVKTLNAACDAMWNDHERLEPSPDRFGQKWRLKERHMLAISQSQQKLPATLAAFTAHMEGSE